MDVGAGVRRVSSGHSLGAGCGTLLPGTTHPPTLPSLDRLCCLLPAAAACCITNSKQRPVNHAAGHSQRKVGEVVALEALGGRQVPPGLVVFDVVHDHVVQAVRARRYAVQRGQHIGCDRVEPACRRRLL